MENGKVNLTSLSCCNTSSHAESTGQHQKPQHGLISATFQLQQFCLFSFSSFSSSCKPASSTVFPPDLVLYAPPPPTLCLTSSVLQTAGWKEERKNRKENRDLIAQHDTPPHITEAVCVFAPK